MKDLKIILMGLFLCSQVVYLPLLAQQNNDHNIKQLTIGDTIDLSAYSAMDLENKLTDQNLGHYKGKWLIIDFWATYCQACIVSMPKLNELQREFKDDLNIIFITTEKRDRVKSFLARSELTKGNKLLFFVEDATYKKIFPHRFIPHQIWIDPKGVIRAITGYEELTEENLRKMIANNNHSLPLKQEKERWTSDINYRKAKMDENVLFKSSLTKRNPSFASTAWYNRKADNIHQVNHVSYFNSIPLQMFYDAMMHLKEKAMVSNLNPNRFVINIKDSLIKKRYANKDLDVPFHPGQFPYLEWSNKKEYYQDNSFNYELTLPKYVDDSVTLFNYVMDDLNKLFPIKAKVEKRYTNSLVIIVKDSSNFKELLRRNSTGEGKFIITDEEVGVFNRSMTDFVNTMKRFRALPIIDETNINFPISLVLNFKDSEFLDKRQGLLSNMLTFDEKIFKAELNKYGLDVIKEKRWVDMLIVTD